MQPGSYDYEVEGGDCLPLIVILKDEDENVISLIGFASEFVATWNTGSITLTSGGGTLDVNDADSPSTGTISGELTPAQTDALPMGRLTKYEWSITQPDGCKVTFLKGFIVRL